MAAVVPTSSSLQNWSPTQPEAASSRGAGDAVGNEAVRALPALERPLSLGAEDPVGGDSQCALERGHAAATRARLASSCRRLGLARQARSQADHGRTRDSEQGGKG